MPATESLFTRLQTQSRRVYGALQGEIERMQSQLDGMRAEANRWRAALGGPSPRGAAAATTSGAKTPKKRAAAKRKPARRGPAIDWDGVLKKLPKTFTSEQLAKATPKLASNPKARVMALARWSRAKAIKKIADKKYAKR